MKEVLDFYASKISKSKILSKLDLKKKSYFIVSAHREENVDSDINLNNFIETLSAIDAEFNLPVIVSTHPRTQKKLEEMKFDFKNNNNIRFLKPFGFCDYIKMQEEALCVISDSGTITEETSILGLTSITIRNAHERPEGMDEGTLIMSGLRKDRVLNAIKIVVNQSKDNDNFPNKITDYDIDVVSKQILRIVLSYTDYIKRTVWSES
jgi:UDP-N-acetylglucosamine 2-epimerase (non-hydrolysing)